MKCYLCGQEAYLKVKEKPLCRACKAHWLQDRELIRAGGVLLLPHIYLRAIIRRFKVFLSGCFRRDKALRLK